MSDGVGALYGNAKQGGDYSGGYEQVDRVGVLLGLGGGSVRFFKNGAQHGPGHATGSVSSVKPGSCSISYGVQPKQERAAVCFLRSKAFA
jgi:hypothetical protein